MASEPSLTDETTQGAGLIDVSDMPLEHLLSADNTPLANSLHRLVAEMDLPEEIRAAHSNAAARR